MNTTVLTLALLVGLSACSTAERANPVTRDLDRAVSLALAALEQQTPPSGDVVAVGARRRARGSDRVWIVTFKLAHLIPTEPDGIEGLGGEVFVTADLATGRTELRRGE